MNYTLTVSQPGYMPTTSYGLKGFTQDELVGVFRDELYRTVEAERLPLSLVLSHSEILDMLDTYGEASVHMGGYVHELVPTEE